MLRYATPLAIFLVSVSPMNAASDVMVQVTATPEALFSELAKETPSIETLETLLTADISLSNQLYNNEFPLHYAAQRGHTAAVSLLLEKKATADIESPATGELPLALACKNRHEQTALKLLEHNTKPLSKDSSDITPLAYASQAGLQTFCEKVVDICGLNPLQRLNDKNTYLHFAVRSGNQALVAFFLEKNVRASHANKHGETPLSIAVREGHKDLIPLLLSKGASLETPLVVHAAETGNVAMLHTMLSAIQDTHEKEKYTQLAFSSALQAESPQEKVCIALLKKRSPVDVIGNSSYVLSGLASSSPALITEFTTYLKRKKLERSLGVAVLYYALTQQKSEAAALLVDAGVPVNTPLEQSFTDIYGLNNAVYQDPPLLYVAKQGLPDCIDILCTAGANPQFKDADGHTPLYYVEQTMPEYQQMLISAGTSLDTEQPVSTPVNQLSRAATPPAEELSSEDGTTDDSETARATPRTPTAQKGGPSDIQRLFIELFAETPNTTTIAQLLEKDPSLVLQKHEGFSPLHVAIYADKPSCIQLLVTAGAPLNERISSTGVTPLAFACQSKKEACALELLKQEGIDLSGTTDATTPLSLAVTNGMVTFCKAYADRFELPLTERFANNATLLHLAVERENEELTRFFLHHGAPVDVRDSSYRTPKELAEESGNSSLIALFTNEEVVLDTPSAEEQALEKQMIEAIISHKGLDKIQELLAQGALLFYQDETGCGYLHHAIRTEQATICQLLLERGCPLLMEDNTEHTALEVALESKNKEIQQVLLVHIATAQYDHEHAEKLARLVAGYISSAPEDAIPTISAHTHDYTATEIIAYGTFASLGVLLLYTILTNK